jgi:hypothetical protein
MPTAASLLAAPTLAALTRLCGASTELLLLRSVSRCCMMHSMHTGLALGGVPHLRCGYCVGILFGTLLFDAFERGAATHQVPQLARAILGCGDGAGMLALLCGVHCSLLFTVAVAKAAACVLQSLCVKRFCVAFHDITSRVLPLQACQ